MDITELTSFLNDTFAPTPAPGVPAPLHWQPLRAMPAGVPASVESYAAVLRASAVERAVRLGSWLATGNGEVFAAAVQAMSPPLAQPAEGFLIRALIQVAAEQNRPCRQGTALLLAGTAALVVALLILLTQRSLAAPRQLP